MCSKLLSHLSSLVRRFLRIFLLILVLKIDISILCVLVCLLLGNFQNWILTFIQSCEYCFCCTVYSPCSYRFTPLRLFSFIFFLQEFIFYYIYIGVLPASVSDSLEQELETVTSTLWMLGIEPDAMEECSYPLSRLSTPTLRLFT